MYCEHCSQDQDALLRVLCRHSLQPHYQGTCPSQRVLQALPVSHSLVLRAAPRREEAGITTADSESHGRIPHVLSGSLTHTRLSHCSMDLRTESGETEED